MKKLGKTAMLFILMAVLLLNSLPVYAGNDFSGFILEDTQVKDQPGDEGESLATLHRGDEISGQIQGGWLELEFDGDLAYVDMTKVTEDPVFVEVYLNKDSFLRLAREDLYKRDLDDLSRGRELEKGDKVYGRVEKDAFIVEEEDNYFYLPYQDISFVEVASDLEKDIEKAEELKDRFNLNKDEEKKPDLDLELDPSDPRPVVNSNSKPYLAYEGTLRASIVVRSEPSSKAEILGRVHKGDYVFGYIEGAWLRIVFEGRTAYIGKQFVTPSKKVVRTGYTSSSLFFRPYIGSRESLGIIPKHTYLEGVEFGNWLQVEYEGEIGYIAKAFVKKLNHKERRGYTTSSVFFRPRIGSSESLGIIPKHTYLEGQENGAWLKTSYQGQTGYVAKAIVMPELWEGYTSCSLMTRTRPSSKSTSPGIISKGTKIKGQVVGAWIRFEEDGQTRYAAKKFIKQIEDSGMASMDCSVKQKPTAKKDLGTISKGSKVFGYVYEDYIKIEWKGMPAYIERIKLVKTLEKFYGMTKYATSVHAEPSGSSAQRGILAKQTILAGEEINPSWILIDYKGGKAYARKEAFTPVREKAVSPHVISSGILTSSIYVRNAPLNNGKKLGIIGKGQFVAGEIQGAWLQINYEGQKAYIAKNFVDFEESVDQYGPNRTFWISLDPGHGAGKAHNRGGVLFNEGDQTYAFSQALTREAKKYKYVGVINSRNVVEDDPELDERRAIATGTDLFLSIHTNAATPDARGVEIWASHNDLDYSLHNKFLNTISTTLSTYNRGIKYKDYYTSIVTSQPHPGSADWYAVVRGNPAPIAMLIEFCFHTNYSDSKAFLDKQDELAEKIMADIADYYNLEKIEDGE